MAPGSGFHYFWHRLPAEVFVAWTGLWILRKGVPLRVSLRLLVDERETDIVLKLRDGEIQLITVLAVFVRVQPIQKLLRKRANHGLLIIVDHVLEELIDELHLEVGQVEACVVVAIELVGEVEHYLVTLALLSREDELVYQTLADVLHLAVARDQTVKFELNLVCGIQIRYAFVFVGDQDALKIEILKIRYT